ncbi:MAG: pyridoxamine 5'-phosphate oxidase family protein [Gemmatimonadaceae bacterium]|nr:pyridoxamine 5'-phosphate oxidase family protein [Gemmatimonadaceae bacterium]
MHKLAALLLLLPAAVGAQVAPKDTAAIVRRLIAGAKYATFVTLDERGAPRSRMVQPKPPERDFTVWFATNPRTRKVQDITRDGRVVLHYFDPVRQGYVSIVGTATVARDKATKDAHWDPAWDAFYKDRENGVVLIGVTPDHLEIVSDKDHITGDNATWRPPVWKPTGAKNR